MINKKIAEGCFRVKRRFAWTLALTLLATTAYAQSGDSLLEETNFDIVIAGEPCSGDLLVLGSRAGWLLQLRTVAVQIGEAQGAAHIVWDAATSSVSVQIGGSTAVAVVGKEELIVNGQRKSLSMPPALYRGAVYVPLDFFEKAFDYQVLWDPDIGRAYLQQRDAYETIYRLLNRSRIVDPTKAKSVSYDYFSKEESVEPATGYQLVMDQKEGNMRYDFMTGECLDQGQDTRMDRSVAYRNHYKNGVFQRTRGSLTWQESDSDKIKLFQESMLSNVDLSLDMLDTPLQAGDDTIPDEEGRSLTTLEKLAAVLQLKETGEGRIIKISGSTMALQSAAKNAGLLQAEMTYVVDSKTDRMIERSQLSRFAEKLGQVSYETTYQWKCTYSVEIR